MAEFGIRSNVERNLDSVRANIPKITGGGARRIAEEIGAESQLLVPYRRGDLRDSMEIAADRDVAGRFDGAYTITYGNAKVGYAFEVHETALNYEHGRQSQYLREPLLTHPEERLQAAAAEALKVMRQIASRAKR